jgi:hypothetical protein
MTRTRSLLAGALALAIALVIAWLSQAPTTYARADDALLRLSWRVDGLRIEECRERTAEELEALAPHMRTPEVCVGGGADYELRVELDGAPLVHDTVEAGGARGDRPVYVYRDIDLSPGRYALRVAFRALVPEAFEADGARVARSFDGAVDVAPTEVVLITLDPGTSDLVQAGR